MIKLNDDIKIKPLDCELSDDIKNYLKMLEWSKNALAAYTYSLFMIPK